MRAILRRLLDIPVRQPTTSTMRVRADRYRQRAADAKDRAGQALEGRTTVALTAQAVNDCRQEPVHDLRPKDSLSSLGRPLARRSRLNPEIRDGGDPAHPGAHAVWPVRAGRSERNLWPAHVFPKWSPPTVAPNPYTRVPETPPRWESGGVSFWRITCSGAKGHAIPEQIREPAS
jgi:hypothetical protein